MRTGRGCRAGRHAEGGERPREPRFEFRPRREPEPISLNAASQIRDYLAREHVKSLILVTPGLRSRRSSLVYHAVLDGLGTQVYCAPVFGQTTPHHWIETWHGVQEVTLEFLKLQYYRFYVLPFYSRNGSGGAR